MVAQKNKIMTLKGKLFHPFFKDIRFKINLNDRDIYLIFHGTLIKNQLLLGLSGVGKTTYMQGFPKEEVYDELIKVQWGPGKKLLYSLDNQKKFYIKTIKIACRQSQRSINKVSFKEFIKHIWLNGPYSKKIFYDRALELYHKYEIEYFILPWNQENVSNP